ncbi:MAG: DUF2752 domain-containing protein [Candidatus Eisenbacteria bacterium]|nr:DUF2752 domain-containing protein [Candidatus Eisenbacteria bacterium]
MKLALERAPREALAEQGVLGLTALTALMAARLVDAGGRVAGLPLLRWIPACPLHQWTGMDCPTCGMTRSFVALAHGQLDRSLHFHPLGPVLFALSGAAGLALLGGWAASRSWRLDLSQGERGLLLGGAVAVLAGTWLLRLTGVFR